MADSGNAIVDGVWRTVLLGYLDKVVLRRNFRRRSSRAGWNWTRRIGKSNRSLGGEVSSVNLLAGDFIFFFFC